VVRRVGLFVGGLVCMCACVHTCARVFKYIRLASCPF